MFMVHSANKSMSAELSEICNPQGFMFEIFSKDHNGKAMDVGITMKSHRTGIVTRWFVSKYVRDGEGDITAWELSPAIGTVMNQPQLDGWMIIIFND